MNLGFPYYWYGVAALSVNDVVVSGHDNAGMAKSAGATRRLNLGLS